MEIALKPEHKKLLAEWVAKGEYVELSARGDFEKFADGIHRRGLERRKAREAVSEQ